HKEIADFETPSDFLERGQKSASAQFFVLAAVEHVERIHAEFQALLGEVGHFGNFAQHGVVVHLLENLIWCHTSHSTSNNHNFYRALLRDLRITKHQWLRNGTPLMFHPDSDILPHKIRIVIFATRYKSATECITKSACGASSDASAKPVITPITYPTRALRPISKSATASPTTTVCVGAMFNVRHKCKIMSGAGLLGKPSSAQTTASM